LKISTAAVPSPAKMPPAIDRNVTRMLFVKITAASRPGPHARRVPRPPGSAAPWNSGGTTPIAAAGSSIAHTAASIERREQQAPARRSAAHGRSDTRCQ
jgi:hypothetical protein